VEKINRLMAALSGTTAIKFSQLTSQSPNLQSQVLVIDNIGMLSSLYQYGEIAYIGGGFGVGIHNTLEAAAFGLPVIFGPNYDKFKEAKDLVSIEAAFTIIDQTKLTEITDKLMADEALCTETGSRARKYVEQNTGATPKILKYIDSLK
jgi:3-deoxy-D-manno-octulosonic-acid transferase